MKTKSAVCLLVGVLIASLVSVSCTSEEPGAVVLTVEQALAGEEGRLIRVQGALVRTEAKVVLASALLESYPPQAGGAILPVEGLELADLVGLSSTAGQPDLAQVTWSDYAVVLEGVIDEGVLQVKKTPPVIETKTAEVLVRFGLPSEPLFSGGMVWWAFDIMNLTGQALDLTFPSGQAGEVVLMQDGVEKYRWSAGRTFNQSVRVDTIQSGQRLPYVLNDTLEVDPGDYDLTARVTATVGPQGAAGSLPEMKTAITVR